MPTQRKIESVESSKHSAADTYYMRFKGGWGWAIVFLHEPTGTFALHTDWGDWAYSWPGHSRGTPTLHEFITRSRGDYDYIANKLMHGRRRDYDCYDADKTIAGMKKRIIEDRTDDWNRNTQFPEMPKERARMLWDELMEHAGCDNHYEFVYAMPKDLSDFFEDPSDYICYKEDPDYVELRDVLLPAIIEQLAKESVPA